MEKKKVQQKRNWGWSQNGNRLEGGTGTEPGEEGGLEGCNERSLSDLRQRRENLKTGKWWS